MLGVFLRVVYLRSNTVEPLLVFFLSLSPPPTLFIPVLAVLHDRVYKEAATRCLQAPYYSFYLTRGLPSRKVVGNWKGKKVKTGGGSRGRVETTTAAAEWFLWCFLSVVVDRHVYVLLLFVVCGLWGQ
ncbi:hypothetical protein, unlikely [Trypanosoma brucei gambiense DAL972]|uniref:Uncharacterized protein n=1 Tax=Trypanosoma brucei gambiense (strain MHOM/CI/86/DAL972) TaxID=679716 RepID=C9ZXC3_TRYB9|nr:hypothetical protein, unlikely [Trypanosoma brucei gambiense DAL972]CBH14067.1 hypothetical protein, unlikely [Trypanosoma brucei gambiense DAL972]|eukprot:XP_011776338.1 hypothetical protein, unlikely [Trypanosoma brucei gambiense DAL972]